MEHSWEDRSEKKFRIIDRTFQNGAWTGIILSRMIHNILPASMKSPGKRLPYFFDDRRRDRRLHVDRNVTYIREMQDTKTAHLLNISRNGIYVETDDPADIGQELSFNLSGRNLGPFMRVRGRVTRKAEHGMAIHFI